MPFGLPITIKEAIEHIHRKEYLLPAIQREFVWKSEQIEKLFDSLMRGYPISSFLFWKVERSNQANYQFYEFIREYHERDNKNNPKASVDGEQVVTAILDGQQRLTSLYIGLKGTYADKLTRMRWNNPSAFPKKKLYLNLLANSTEADLEYDFQFKTDDDIKLSDPDQYLWFNVGDVMNFKSLVDVNKYLINNVFTRFANANAEFANEVLCKLFEIVHQTKSINFFLEEDESLNKVLDIFVRINSGGTQLSYSDLLLSIASAEWKERDAREEINSFVKELNNIGDGFNINKDFVLKSCLVLTDKEIAFRVENFSPSTMLDIERAWPLIIRAIKTAVILLSSLGYQRDTLTSNNAIIPIAYYLKKIGSPENFHIAKDYEEDRKKIVKWLRMALLKRAFSGQPDNVLRPIREVISNDPGGTFPIEGIVDKFIGKPKSLAFTDDEVINLMSYEYGEAYTYSALAFLYPTLDFRNRFHVDHIYPKSIFTRKELLKQGVKEQDISIYLDSFNSLANLQLLEGIPNQEKSSKSISEWLVEAHPDAEGRALFCKKNFIPNVELTLINFPKFIELRRELLINRFKEILDQ